MNSRFQLEEFLLRLYFTSGIGKAYQQRILQGLSEQRASPPFGPLLTPALFRGLEIPPALLENFKDSKTLELAQKEHDLLQKYSVRLLSLLDCEYPSLLRQIHSAPPILFYRGNFLDWENRIGIGFVGTRRVSDYGKKVIRFLVEGLSQAPLFIVSGFAKGIDACAHTEALRAGIPTVGVLGTGLGKIYPKENESLYYSILEQGGFFTEYAFNTEPHPGYFPDRNRIISGLCKGIVLVEVPEKSGALITARFALEQNREIMVVPGNILSAQHGGSHRLIQQGAKLVARPEDLLEELQISANLSSPTLKTFSSPPLSLDPMEEALLVHLGFEPVHVDKLSEISTLDSSVVMSTLTTLMLKGVVEELPGKFFIRN